MKKYYILLFVLIFYANANALKFHTYNSSKIISASITPDFPQSLSICNGNVAPVLANVSPNGITGTWTPAFISTITPGTYTFTPTPGQDATTVVMNVTIVPIPPFSVFCSLDFLNAITFDWNNVIGGTGFHYSYTIDNGTPVSGAIVNPSNYTVFGLLPGQTVVFTVSVDGNTCALPQTTTCSTLANNDFGRELFSYYPNPVTDILNLSAQENIDAVRMFNVLGQEILHQTINARSAQLPLSGLQSGLYFMEVNAAQQSKIVQVIKN